MRRGVGVVEVLHVKVEARVVLVHENAAEHEYQDDRERNREEHCGLLAVETLNAHDEISADHAQVHSASLPPAGPSRSASPVSLRNTSSRLGLRTSRVSNDAPASLMVFSIFRTSSVCSTLILMFLWLSWTGSKPIFRTISKAFSSTDCSVRTR